MEIDMNKILTMLSEELEVDYDILDKLDDDADLTNYGFNSLNSVMLVIFLEEEYDISLLDENLSKDMINTKNKLKGILVKYLKPTD